MNEFDELIERIQKARKGAREVFPSILNDVMIALAWTEQQAAERLDTNEKTIGRWMAGGSIPTTSVREAAYERMICSLVEQECLNKMVHDWVEQNRQFYTKVVLPIGIFAIMVGLGTYFYLT